VCYVYPFGFFVCLLAGLKQNLASFVLKLLVRLLEADVHGRDEETARLGASMTALTERQRMLIALIQSLDPDLRHTVEIECRGTEPWSVSVIKERRDIQLKGGTPR
jgi:hypothetical protein